MKQSISWNGDTVTITYEGGVPPFIGDCRQLPQVIYQPCEAARHGIAQKLGDAKSGGSAREKRAEVEAIWESLMASKWRRGREATDPGLLLARALVIIAKAKGLGKEAEKRAAEWLTRFNGLPEKEQDMFLRRTEVKAAMNAARAEIRLGRLAGQAEGNKDEDDIFA